MDEEREIREIAEIVRAAFEQISPFPCLGGSCGRAAFQFFLEADRRGLEGVRLVKGSGHGFCKLADGRIVDVTATQFNGLCDTPPDGYGSIVIGKLSEDPPGWHSEKCSWSSVEEFLAYEFPFFGARQHRDEDRQVVESIMAARSAQQKPAASGR